MKTSAATLRLVALMLFVVVSTLSVAPAQTATRARRITEAQAKPYKWPTFRQVKSKTSVPEVKVIQFLLRNQGYFNRRPDGIFGNYTTSRVRAFQRAKRIKSDGIVGPQTWRHLLLRLRKGDRGDAVRALQTILRQTTGHEAQYLTPNLAVDGIFGDSTEEALRIAQEAANTIEKRAAVDGIAGPQIWSILLADSHEP